MFWYLNGWQFKPLQRCLGCLNCLYSTWILKTDTVRHVRIKTKAVLNMLKRLDKIRFRGQRPDVFLDLGDSPNASDTECIEEIPIKPQSFDNLRPYWAGPVTPAMAAVVLDDQRSEADRLNELKGHLEIALLEKHFLQEELRKLRDETNIETLKQELEKEKSKRLDLELKLNKQKDTAYSRLQTWLYNRFGAYIEDFRFQPEENTVEPEEPLSAKRLTENMRRLKRGAKPVTNFKRNLFALSSWHSVYTSAFAFIIYMNAAWHGWAIPLFLFLAIIRLSLNYLISRGWRIQWSIVPEVSEPVDPPKEDLTVSEKFQLVLDVAQKAQVSFDKVSRCLVLLFMWVDPEMTQKLYIGLWVAFICSCLLPYKLMGFVMGLYAGFKFFVVDFIFRSCPKLRDKYDTPYIIWTSLPTDPQLKERGGASLSRRIHPAVARGSQGMAVPCGTGLEEPTGRAYNTKKGAFHEVFNLSEDERPLAVCENGWRCCLINRDRKTPTDYIRNGVLYVTENYLCFESSSSRSNSSKKNKVIKLTDINDIQKYKVLSVLPGSGMGISIATPYTQKPMVFGAMIHRDEAFEAIFTQYKKIVTTTATCTET
uniref:GRAM domain-containing protein n=1 Tax=Esox lucius TaxID=8010 RepID=A0A3P8YLC6_ESOLU